MIRIFGTIFAGLLGLAFGSFLNVCLTRWPQGESIVQPRSHCRNCDHSLSWWENIPLLSWLALRGRCRNCRTWIGWRYPVVELAVGLPWAFTAWQCLPRILYPYKIEVYPYEHRVSVVQSLVLYLLLVGLAALDAEHLWLPDRITLPAILTGSLFELIPLGWIWSLRIQSVSVEAGYAAVEYVLGILAAAGLILLIRWLYKLIRHREGIGLGDAKLMALLAAWLGLPGALLSFGIGVVLGALVAVVLLVVPRTKPDPAEWSLRKLPLGTFLCIGGIISSLWGQPIIAAYLRWAGL
ncbi:MAG: prepilin peptidase [Terracidiphilus sp.]|jgi:leader peptidase (prepilin peptidase)/N-methyltransferase